MIKKYKKELREQRAIRKANEGYYTEMKESMIRKTGVGGYGDRNQYMIAHGKIKILNMIIKDYDRATDKNIL
jgi:hypothetical protein